MKVATQEWNKMKGESPPDKQLRILQVNSSDGGGGAERAAWNLFHTYRARGHKSWLAVGYKRTEDPDVLVVANGLGHYPDDGVERGFRWLQKKIRGVRRLEKYYRTLRH